MRQLVDHRIDIAPEYVDEILYRSSLRSMEYVEEALYRLARDNRTMLNHVLMSLKLWSMIASYRRTANKDRKKRLTTWMTGKVTETIYIKKCVVCCALSNKMKKCSGCYTAYYCSEDCQNIDWPVHQARCKTFRPSFSPLQFSPSPFQREVHNRAKLCQRLGIPYEPIYNRTEDPKICVTCGVKRRRMKYCSGCKVATYCSKECQIKDWKAHKKRCDPDDGFRLGTQGIALCFQPV